MPGGKVSTTPLFMQRLAGHLLTTDVSRSDYARGRGYLPPRAVPGTAAHLDTWPVLQNAGFLVATCNLPCNQTPNPAGETQADGRIDFKKILKKSKHQDFTSGQAIFLINHQPEAAMRAISHKTGNMLVL